MAKKKPPKTAGKGKKKGTATFYVHIDEIIKERFERVAAFHRRKMNAEAEIVLDRYCTEIEASIPDDFMPLRKREKQDQ